MPSAPTQRVTVLVADDDPVMRLLMLEMLAQVGLDAIEAGDGIEALAQARSSRARPDPDGCRHAAHGWFRCLQRDCAPPNATASASRSSW